MKKEWGAIYMFKKDGVISLIDYFNTTIMINYLNLEKSKSEFKIDQDLKFQIENVMLDLRSLFLQLEDLINTINTNQPQIMFKNLISQEQIILFENIIKN